jgi:hypothetical protein
MSAFCFANANMMDDDEKSAFDNFSINVSSGSVLVSVLRNPTFTRLS